MTLSHLRLFANGGRSRAINEIVVLAFELVEQVDLEPGGSVGGEEWVLDRRPQYRLEVRKPFDIAIHFVDFGAVHCLVDLPSLVPDGVA